MLLAPLELGLQSAQLVIDFFILFRQSRFLQLICIKLFHLMHDVHFHQTNLTPNAQSTIRVRKGIRIRGRVDGFV